MSQPTANAPSGRVAEIRASAAPALVGRAALIAKLRREVYREDEVSDPCTTDFERGYDLGYRSGHNRAHELLIAWLSQGDIEAGLAELRDAEVIEQPPRHWLAEVPDDRYQVIEECGDEPDSVHAARRLAKEVP